MHCERIEDSINHWPNHRDVGSQMQGGTASLRGDKGEKVVKGTSAGVGKPELQWRN